MPKLRMTSAQMVADARARIDEIDIKGLKEIIEEPNVVLVDIRDIRERQRTGFIPGSVHAPRGMVEFWVDPESPYHKEVFAMDGHRYVFYCASGWRSALTVSTLKDMGFDAEHLRDGFSSWVDAGGSVEKPDTPSAS
ncbi:MAG: rhodanese-like domain-containing protein [Pseudomonadota bacterium]